MTVELIHPYDMYDLLSSGDATKSYIVIGKGIEPCRCSIECDPSGVYSSECPLVEIGGKMYMETTSVPYRSKSFNEKTEQLSTALSSPNQANPL